MLAGGDAVHFHMLNKESRSYFQRVLAASGTALTTNAITKVNHVQQLQECWKINEMDKLIEYLKSESSDTLMKCPQFENPVNLNKVWAPVVESNATKGAFLTKTPREIYSDPDEELPFMDTMFSFTSQVPYYSSALFQTHMLIFIAAGSFIGSVEHKCI